MPDNLPDSVPVLVIGAGVHGLSTAWHLAQQGQRVLVVDKTDVAAGASGIACGVIRNNYFQPAMSELMAACVEVWESDPQALHYHGSGYIALGPPAQESDLIEVYARNVMADGSRILIRQGNTAYAQMCERQPGPRRITK